MQEGLVTLVVGMGTVFAFLVLLVALMQLSAWFFTTFARWFPDEVPAVPMPSAASDELEVAVVLAAIRSRLH